MLQSKFWQAFFALAPLFSLVFIFIGYGFFLYNILSEVADGRDPEPSLIFGSLGLIFTIVFFVILISLGSLIFYIVHAAKNPNLRENNLLLVWILLFVFASGFGQLIYWIVEILNKPESPDPQNS